MENYFMLDGIKIKMSEETAESLRKTQTQKVLLATSDVTGYRIILIPQAIFEAADCVHGPHDKNYRSFRRDVENKNKWVCTSNACTKHLENGDYYDIEEIDI